MINRRLLMAGLGSASLAASAAFAQTAALNGDWTGVLSVGSASLRLKLVIGDGTAVLFSLDQGAQPIPATVASLTPEKIELTFPVIQARYTGKMVGADRIEGQLIQGQGLPLVFLRGEAGLTAAAAQPLTDEGLAALRQTAGAPAMAAAARKGAGAVRSWVVGERAKDSGVAATGQDQWHLGSITKSMTATLVGRLVDAGKIKWDDSVGQVLGAAIPGMRPEYKAATFRHLLSHRSGLQANIEMAQLAGFSQQLDDARAERLRYAGLALAQAPVGPAETTFTYSNNGFIVAGAMLEQVLGKPWEALMREHLFAPLGLATAGFGAPGRSGTPIQPVGHAQTPAGLAAFPVGSPVTDNPAALSPAGRVHMAMDDVLTYLAAHRDRSSLLRPETWRMLHTPPFGSEYAMGWVVTPAGALWHNGSNTFWYAEVTVNPATGKIAVAAANAVTAGSQPAVGKALAGALAAV